MHHLDRHTLPIGNTLEGKGLNVEISNFYWLLYLPPYVIRYAFFLILEVSNFSAIFSQREHSDVSMDG